MYCTETEGYDKASAILYITMCVVCVQKQKKIVKDVN